MKNTLCILLTFMLFSVSGIHAAAPEANSQDNIQVCEKINGQWYGKTYKTIFRLPVIFTAHFTKRGLFTLNVKVLGYNYDNVTGAYRIDEDKRLLTLIGWRERTSSRKKLVFQIMKFSEKHIYLRLLEDDGEIENSKKPIAFVRDISQL